MSLQHIGRYQLKHLLGKGGMASVYLAHDPYFERDVAVKILPREFLHDPVFRSRFQREAKTIAAMEHPAIVPVYDFGEEDNQPFLVMRLMPGGSLADRIQQGPISFTEIAWIVERIASGFDAAHHAGIVHRDMKPSNILLDHHGNPYIADFGIVKLSEHSAALTGTGMIGTPSYMAPEMGDPGGVTHLVDIYALGVTIFQMLTGRLPFLADTPSGILIAHVVKPVPDPRDVQPGLPPSVFAFIQKAMAKNPAERFQSAGEMASALNALELDDVKIDSAVPIVTEGMRDERSEATTHLDLDSPSSIAGRKGPPVRLLGISGGILGIALASLILTNVFPFDRSATPPPTDVITEVATESEQLEATEEVADSTSTTATTSTEVSLQPTISMIFGTTEVMSDSELTFVLLQTSKPLRKGDTVRTAAQSAALLTLSSSISVEIHPESEIKLVDLIESRDGLTVLLQQTSGISYHVLTPSANGQAYHYTVMTQFATITATGTEFWVAEQKNGWCAQATEGSIAVDVGDEDEATADNYLASAEDEIGWMIGASGEVTTCTLDNLSRLTGSTATPTPTAVIRTAGTTGGTAGDSGSSGETTGGSTTDSGSTTGSTNGGGTSDTGTTGSGPVGGSDDGGDPPPPTAPPTNTPIPPTNTSVPPTNTPNCGQCGDGGGSPSYQINCGTSATCTNEPHTCEKWRDTYDGCGNVCASNLIGCERP